VRLELLHRLAATAARRQLAPQPVTDRSLSQRVNRRSVRFSIVGALPQLPHITGFSVRLGGICPAARCRGTLVPGRI